MSIQYGRKCLLCNNTRYRSKQCRLFRFPARGSHMWRKWLAALELADIDIDVYSNEPPRLCQLHFEPKDFLQRKLSGMAIPIRSKQISPENRISNGDTVEQIDPGAAMLNTKDNGQVVVQLEAFVDEASVTGMGHDYYAPLSNCGEDLAEPESNEYGLCSSPFLIVTDEQTSLSSANCSMTQHATLVAELEKERARVKELLETNAQQRHIIEDQRNLLMQLGVQYSNLDEAEDS